MGLFEAAPPDSKLTAAIGSPEHRQVARQCVRESLVLLKNENHLLPLSKKIKTLAVVGEAAEDIGVQCGGWTIDWQGGKGEVTHGGTTILAAIRQAVSPETRLIFSKDGSDLGNADAIISVVGESPYAEMKGDSTNLDLPPEDAGLISKVKAAGKPQITILISGRPQILNSVLTDSTALIAAWLPGTEGQGVADVLFGDYKFTGKLPRSWPRSNLELRANQVLGRPLFPMGYGLKD
jgi:beta-glucosidase